MDNGEESDIVAGVCHELTFPGVEDDVLEGSITVVPVKKIDIVKIRIMLWCKSWSTNYRDKKHRCLVNRSDLSPQLKAYVDLKKIPCLKNK